MASDSNIKKVTLEIGGQILRSKTWTDIEGYFETTEVGLGTFTNYFSVSKCYDEDLKGIPDWVYEEDNSDVLDALEDDACGDQRNTAPYFNLPQSNIKGDPNYVGFKIIDIETIGQSQTNELSEGNSIVDADEDMSNLTLNTNSFTTNTDISDMRTYEDGNPIYDSFNSFNPVQNTWEFKPGPFTPIIGEQWIGIEYVMPAWPGGGKTIWKFTCEKAHGQEANFRSPGIRGVFGGSNSWWPFSGEYSGCIPGGSDWNEAYNPQWDAQSNTSNDCVIPIFNENISSGCYGAYNNPYPGNVYHDYKTPFSDEVLDRHRLGAESVQGRSLYLYPSANSPYKHPIVFDVFEGVSDAIWVRGSANGILKFVCDLVKRQILEDYGPGSAYTSLGSGYTVDMEALDWAIPLDDVYPYTFSDDLSEYWPDGLEMSIQGFFSTYKCYLSPYLHSGLWSYKQSSFPDGSMDTGGGIVFEENPGDVAEESNSGAVNPLSTTGGIIGLKQDISATHAIGSSIAPIDWDYYTNILYNPYSEEPTYPFNPGSVVTPTYNQYRRLGWRSACFDALEGDWKWGIAGNWAEDAGFALEMRISEIENCEVWVLTDYLNSAEKYALENLPTYMTEWGNGDLVYPAVPFSSLVVDSIGDSVAISGYNTTDDGGENRDLMVGRRITSVGNTLTCMPRAYSPFTENAGTNVGKGGMIMSSGLMKRHWKEIMTITAAHWYKTYYTWMDCIDENDNSEDCVEIEMEGQTWIWNDFFQPYIEYHEEDHAPASHWEFIHIQPIDPSLPSKCEIGSFKVYKHGFNSTIESVEDTELVTEFIIEAVIEDTQTQIKDTWEQLDILDNKGVPLSLNFATGDLRDVTKRTAGFSKTFEIPANPHNDRVIGMLSGPGRYRDGESVKWRKGRVKSGDVEVFKGYVRIEGFKTSKGGRYKCHIVEDPAAWPTLIGDATICELSDAEEGGIRFIPKTSEYMLLPFGNGMDGSMPGVFTGSGLASNYQILDGLDPQQDRSYYKFPPINYGKWETGLSPSYLLSQSIHPAVNVRYLLNKIFKSIGYTLESKWMDDPQDQYNGDAPSWVGKHSTMSRLVLPYTSGEDYANTEDSTGPNGQYMAAAGRTEMIHLANTYQAGYPGEDDAITADNGDWYSSFPGFIEETDPMDCYNENPEPPEPSFNAVGAQVSFTGDGYGDVSGPPWNGLISGGYTVPFTGRYRLLFKAWFMVEKDEVFSDCQDGVTVMAAWHIKQPGGDGFYPLTAESPNSLVSGGLIESNNPSTVNQYWTGVYRNYDSGSWDEGETPGSPWNVTVPGDMFMDDTNVVNGHIGAKARWAGNSPFLSGEGNDWGQWRILICEVDIDLQEGQIAKMGFYGDNDCGGSAVAVMMKKCELLFYPLAETAEPENPVSFSTALGCNVKQMDIIKGVTEMFNLHWTADVKNKIVYAEPYDEFYGSGKILDWSNKLDMNSWEDVYVINEAAKEVFFRYATDSGDGLIVDFEEVEGNDPLWSKRFSNDGIFNKRDKEENGTDVFASTMQFKQSLTSGGDLTWPCGGTPDMPILWKDDENAAGNKPNVTWQDGTERPDADDSGGSFDLRIIAYFGNNPAAGLTVQTASQTIDMGSFPYFGTQNMEVAANKDYHNLSWENREAQIEIDGVQYTVSSLGLFDKHWKRQYEKITGQGTLRICYFNLQDEDIELFDYRDIIKVYFDHVATYWTVNKIIDYKPGASVLTKVELVEYDLQKEQLTMPVSIYKKEGITDIKKPIKRKPRKSKPKVVTEDQLPGYGHKSLQQGVTNVFTHKKQPSNKKQDGSLKNQGAKNLLKKTSTPIAVDKYGEVIINGGAIQASMDIDGKSILGDVYYYDWKRKKNCKLYKK